MEKVLGPSLIHLCWTQCNTTYKKWRRIIFPLKLIYSLFYHSQVNFSTQGLYYRWDGLDSLQAHRLQDLLVHMIVSWQNFHILPSSINFTHINYINMITFAFYETCLCTAVIVDEIFLLLLQHKIQFYYICVVSFSQLALVNCFWFLGLKEITISNYNPNFKNDFINRTVEIINFLEFPI